MKYSKIHRSVVKIFTLLFFLGVFVFFAFFYNNHLHFIEQLQLFLLSGDYFINSIKVAGGFAGYTGEFLVQFFHLPFAGALIITSLLFFVQQLVRSILYSIRPNEFYFPLTFLPSLIYWIMICDEFYMISGLTGFALALLFAKLYTSNLFKHLRLLAGLVMIPLTYFLVGGAYLAFTAIVIAYELFNPAAEAGNIMPGKVSGAINRKWYRLLYPLVIVLLAVFIPLTVRRYFILENTIQAYMSTVYYNVYSPSLLVFAPPAILLVFSSVPLLMVFFRLAPVKERRNKLIVVLPAIVMLLLTYGGIKRNMNVFSEEIMTYDHLARTEEWKEIISYADHKPPRNNNLSLSMLNLALAKTGLMPDRMFSYTQHDSYGLFVPFMEEYGLPMFTSEVFYHLGLINASQHFAFESLSSTPGNKQNVRAIKRLAETNLINGQHEVADKYLKLLEKTLFYRKWAKETRKFLYHDELLDSDSVYGEKRRLLMSNDFFFNMNDIDTALKKMLEINPQHKIAFEYLMAYYLVNKDLDSFVENLYLMDELHYAEIPKSYQEAVCFVVSLPEFNTAAYKYFPNNFEVLSRLENFAYVYTRDPDAQETLKSSFSDTYWYFLHYL